MGSVDRVRDLLSQVELYGLLGCEELQEHSVEELADMYNGIGPEWFPDILRRAIDRRHADFQPCALVHDFRYATGDGSRERFDAANDEFLENGHIIADAKYGWWDPRRYVRRHQARLFARLCRDFGWGAYRTACLESARKDG